MEQKLWLWASLILFYFLTPLYLKEYQIPNNLKSHATLDIVQKTSNSKEQTNLNFINPISGNLAKYCRFSNLASRSIYENNFVNASSLYDSAFIYKKHPFYVDLVNYVLVNDKCCLYDKNDVAILQLIIYKKLDTFQLFRKLPRRVFSKTNLTLINKLSKAQTKVKYLDNKIQKSLRQIFAIDQSIRDYDNIDKKDKATIKEIYAKRDSVDDVNFIKFEKLCLDYGFPGEETVGVYFNDDSEWANIVYVLLLHFIHQDNKEIVKRVIDIIQKALYNGELHPSICANLLDEYDFNSGVRREGFNFLNTTIFFVGADVYRPFVFYSDSLMKDINTNRIAIGLDSFHIIQKQVVCQFFGNPMSRDTTKILMAHYAQTATIPAGFVKMSAKEANVDLANYKINIPKILNECNCMEKVY